MIDQQQAAKRYLNMVAMKDKSLLVKFIEQFKDLMIIILIVAAVLSVVTSGGEDIATPLLSWPLLSSTLPLVFTKKVRLRKLLGLSSLCSVQQRVFFVMVSTKWIQRTGPGDIVILEAGDVAPADLILEANSLKLRSCLTGEFVPAEKTCLWSLLVMRIGDRVNMAFQNSNVTGGRGIGVVVNTGMYTEVGHIAGMYKCR